MNAALAAWRARGRVTLIDKLADVDSVAELDGMRAALSARGVALSDEEVGAFARRRVALQREGKA